MNEELTTEVLEAMKRCNETHCNECLAVGVCCSEDDVTIGERLATALLAERAKPKVWDGAPDNARRGIVNWYDKNRGFIKSKVLTRELPKTRARQIAEEIVDELDSLPRHNTDIEVIESILNKYAEELTKKETQ